MAAVGRPAKEAVHRVRGVVGIEPLEPAGFVAALVDRRTLGNHGVGGAHQLLHPAVLLALERRPVDTVVQAPLTPLADLAAHEHERRPRIGPHPPEERTKAGELLPLVAGHLVDERALAVDDLVVRDRQREPLGERIQQTERELAMMPAPMYGIVGEVAQRVVHPTHVPLVGEAEATVMHGVGHLRPRGRFLGDREHAMVLTVHDAVEVAQEGDGGEVLAPAVLVRHPLSRLARVVEVEHRGDSVDAQTVDVELGQPVERVGDEEVPDLEAAVVEDVRSPVGVLALPRVGVLVQRGAVEASEGPVVLREVRRYPVEDHADAAPVQLVDEEAEVVRRAPARGRGEVAGDLVAPRRPERMLGHRQQLDVGEAEVGDVVGQRRRQLAVAETGAPRADVQLVDAHRVPDRMAIGARRHPGIVVPLMRARPDDHAGGGGRVLGPTGERIGTQLGDAIATGDGELVAIAGRRARNIHAPDPRAVLRLQRIGVGPPAVPVADDGDRGGVRRPHREPHAGPVDVRPQDLPQAVMTTLLQEVQIEFTEEHPRDRSGRGPPRRSPLVRATEAFGTSAPGKGRENAVTLGGRRHRRRQDHLKR